MMIAYELISSKWQGWAETEVFLGPWIDRYHCKDILEIGAAANPSLNKTYVREAGLRYVIRDISAGEMAKAEPKDGAEFDPLAMDVEQTEYAQLVAGQFECIFSIMAARGGRSERYCWVGAPILVPTLRKQSLLGRSTA